MTLKRIIFKLGLGRRFYPETHKRLVGLWISRALKQQRMFNAAIAMQDLEVRRMAVEEWPEITDEELLDIVRELFTKFKNK